MVLINKSHEMTQPVPSPCSIRPFVNTLTHTLNMACVKIVNIPILILLSRTNQNKTHYNVRVRRLNLQRVCVLPAEVSAAAPLERWGPPARGRCSGSRTRRTAAPTREDAGSAGRRGPSTAGSCSAAPGVRGQTEGKGSDRVFKCRVHCIRNLLCEVEPGNGPQRLKSKQSLLISNNISTTFTFIRESCIIGGWSFMSKVIVLNWNFNY